MTIFSIFAGIAYLLIDIFSLLSVIGSAIILIASIVESRMGRRFRAPEKLYLWSIGGLFIGIGGLASIYISGEFTTQKTPWLDYSMTTVGVLLFVSLLLFVAAKMVQSRARPLRQTFPATSGRVRAKSYK